MGGALQFDSASGPVTADPILGLGEGVFGVFAWVKGGAPGQVVISQQKTSWLMANPVDGSLMTKLTGPRQTLACGYSQAVITDGQWHRIGLVWDGTSRTLCVDDNEVANDKQSGLAVSDGGFTLGAGSPGPGTYWSGLIDDVRIYNRVVKP